MTDKQDKKLHGTYAEFDAVDTLLAACARVRDAGYTKTDAFTPFPVHGIDKALGIKPTRLPWIALICGATGTCIAVAMQVWMNTINYPYIISGKPFFSMPAFIPVSFELTILLASFGAFFGMLVLNGLPKFSNPIFTDPRFDRATDDKFFLYIDAADDRYDRAGVTKFLEELGGGYTQDVYDDDSSTSSPKAIWVVLGSVIFLSMIPLLLVARMRVTTSSQPRFHVFFDMDFSPAKDAQMTSSLFADGRAMRTDVPGTVAIGQFDEDLDFYTGIDFDALTRREPVRAAHLVRAIADEESDDAETAATDESIETADEPTDAAAEPEVTGDPEVEDDTPWLEKNPLPITMAVLERGRMQFDIYCATCHGNNGRGAGLVHRRAQRILAGAWVQPSSLHQDTLYADVYPDGKMFSTISNGIRKMAGYSSQINARDRWAVVAYVRALQASQNATLDDLPVDKRDEIRKLQAEVKQRLEEQAEAERLKAEQAAAEKAEAEAEAEAEAANGEAQAAESSD